MKTIGLIGGTGWVSTVEYYRIINQAVNEHLGGLFSARCVLYSLNFGELDELKNRNDFEGVFLLLRDAAHKLINAGADCILLCANTTHMHADRLEKEISVPLIHIAEATGEEIRKRKLSKIGLLGTIYTMEENFYKEKLKKKNIKVIIPDKADREFINHSIFNELLKEIYKKTTKQIFLNIIGTLKDRGAEGIILGCTEIPLIIKDEDSELPLFNTTLIHSLAAVEFALK